MGRYILIRFFQGIIALFVISIVIFLLARLSGDPTSLLLPINATPADREHIVQYLGLDKPLPVQYQIFITQALKGDLGESIRVRVPVTQLIGERLPNSLKLAGAALCIIFIIGIPLGVMAAYKKGRFMDKLARLVAGLGQSAPHFWVGLILMEIFAVRLRLLPVAGMGTWQHYIMPAFVMAWFEMAAIIRLLRRSMLDSLDSEYIRMARIKGISERAIVWKHAFRNSLLAPVSFGGVYAAMLITCAIVTETVFAWPGFGRLAYDAILFRDFPLMQGVVLTTAVIVITVNLVTDILYAYLDPRIRY